MELQNALSVPVAKTPMPDRLAAAATGPQTAPPAEGTATSTVVDPLQDVPDDILVDDKPPMPTPIDTEAETKLMTEITELWGVQKNGKASMRHTRAELKALRQQLGEKLHAMKLILVRTGRGGGWAAYLRDLHLPVSSADRYVAEHEASLAPRQEKLPTGGLSILDQIRQLAKKILPKVSGLLTTQELVYEFVHELVWNIDIAEAWYTDSGFEIPRVGSDDAPEVDATIAELANFTPAVS